MSESHPVRFKVSDAFRNIPPVHPSQYPLSVDILFFFSSAELAKQSRWSHCGLSLKDFLQLLHENVLQAVQAD